MSRNKEIDNSAPIPTSKQIKRVCNLCGEKVGHKIKRHTLSRHLPWYLHPEETCWECETYVRDVDKHICTKKKLLG